jgi:hypothetical protein
MDNLKKIAILCNELLPEQSRRYGLFLLGSLMPVVKQNNIQVELVFSRISVIMVIINSYF